MVFVADLPKGKKIDLKEAVSGKGGKEMTGGHGHGCELVRLVRAYRAYLSFPRRRRHRVCHYLIFLGGDTTVQKAQGDAKGWIEVERMLKEEQKRERERKKGVEGE
jgi:hypothetical protein